MSRIKVNEWVKCISTENGNSNVDETNDLKVGSSYYILQALTDETEQAGKDDYRLLSVWYDGNYIGNIDSRNFDLAWNDIDADNASAAYSSIQLELSGRCNAKCKYCVTGQNNLNGKCEDSYLSVGNFEKAMLYMYENDIINCDTYISLFNYGEPLLHPEFKQILEVLNRFGNPFEISTNGSIPISEDVSKLMYNMKRIQFSMCGFSQDSYDKIHGFDFDKIRRNIEQGVHMLHKLNRNIECILKYQAYQFNITEFQLALEFTYKVGMTIIPIHALYANLQQQIEFMENYQLGNYKEQGTELLWYYLDNMLKDYPENFKCPQLGNMVIDEQLNVAQCCMITKDMEDYTFGNLFKLNLDEFKLRDSKDICKRCIESKTAYTMLLTPSFKYNLIQHYLDLNLDKDIIIVGNDDLTKSITNMYMEGRKYTLYDRLTESVIEKAAKYKENTYIILAYADYWKDVSLLENQNLNKYKNYLIYNMYIR